MAKKKTEIRKTFQYFVFMEDPSNSNHYIFCGDYDTREDAEHEMEFSSEEPENVQYKVIKGEQLDYEHLTPIFPFKINE